MPRLASAFQDFLGLFEPRIGQRAIELHPPFAGVCPDQDALDDEITLRVWRLLTPTRSPVHFSPRALCQLRLLELRLVVFILPSCASPGQGQLRSQLMPDLES